MSTLKIMLVDDDELINKSMSNILEMEKYDVKSITSAKETLHYLETEGLSFDIIITDINMPDLDGLSFIKILKERYGDSVELLVLTGYGSIENAVQAIKLGATGFFEKQADPQLLILEIEKIKKNIELRNRMKKMEKDLLAKRYEFYLFHFKNKKVNGIFSMAKQIAEKDVNVLITGESGTGKEILARYIHQHSLRHNKLFLPVNCNTIPDTLFESEMFGHAKGSFTGAISQHTGYFQRAEGGTLFLDEIGEMSFSNQAKLLRVLEDRSFFPVGEKKALQSDCRIITATNANLHDLIDAGKFRKDMYFRINTVEFTMPPLRERKEDILDLANYYMDFFNKKYQKEVNGISDDAKRWLVNRKWIGNMRELNHVIERAVLFSQGDTIDMGILSKHSNQNRSIGNQNGEVFPYRQAKRNFEISYFQKVLEKYKGNMAVMAKQIGLDRTYIYRKLKELNL